MKKINIKSSYPHIIALIIFISISYIYNSPVISGKVVNQSDVTSFLGAAKESLDLRESGEEALWTNSMFGGMPTTLISMKYKGNFLDKIYSNLFLGPRPASYFILAFVGFYLLMLAIGVSPWLSIMGAIAFGFCAYNFQIIQVGHNGKMVAIAFMPWVLASAIYAFNKNRLLGGIFLSLSLSFEIMANHPQITYYLGMTVLFFVIAELYKAVKSNNLKDYTKTISILLLAVILSVGANTNRLWSTWEYGKQTMRGGSELETGKQQSKNGLNKEYATAWSYGIEETPNLLIPNFNGGASDSELSENSETYKNLIRGGVSKYEAKKVIKHMPTYWGSQPFTAGPMYMGAISIFMFVLGLFLVKGVQKWWIVGIIILSIMLGWGRNFMWLSHIFFDYVPLYSKFRVPSMILIILQLCIPILGIYVLDNILKNKYPKAETIKALKYSSIITAGFCLIFVLFPSFAGDFTSQTDSRLPNWLSSSILSDRISMLRNDALRSLAFIILAAIFIWMFIKEKIKSKYIIVALSILIIGDMWTIGRRYLNNEHFVTKRERNNSFTERPVDKEILKDKDINYRVLDLSVNTFNNSTSSYFHKTIGGYSAGKLQRYQDIIERNISPEIMELSKNLQEKGIQDTNLLKKSNVLNMLNTKYIIINPNSKPLTNPQALGNAWFVYNHIIANSPLEEIKKLEHIDPTTSLIVDKNFSKKITDYSTKSAGDGYIILKKYSPNRMIYKFSSKENRMTVFSEIYYPKGWKAYIDGKETEILRVNYILRGLIIPNGEHEIIFEFKPKSYFTGGIISGIASAIILLSLLASIVILLRTSREKVKN